MKRKTWALLFAIEAIWAAGLVGALADRRAHQRDPATGINQWGYRDEAKGSKEAGERRVAMVGGSSAFEAGMPFPDTLAGQLFIELRQAGAPARQVYRVVNLAEPRAAAESYADTLRRYDYLRADAVCIFDGYDALTGIPPHARVRSVVFRATGYLPILPATLLGRPGWLSDADGGVIDVLRDRPGPPDDVSCGGLSKTYCEAVEAAIRFGLERRYAVLFVTPPAVSSRHLRQQQSLAAALRARFASEPRFKHLDLSSIDLADRVNSPDGVRRTDIGNHVAAQRIATTLLQWPAFMK